MVVCLVLCSSLILFNAISLFIAGMLMLSCYLICILLEPRGVFWDRLASLNYVESVWC